MINKVLFILIYTLVFDAIIRYYLNILGVGFLIYLRDVLVVFAIILFFFKYLNNITNKHIFYKILLFLLIWVVIGTLETSVLQAFFGLKIFLPILFGIIIYDNNYKKNKFSNFIKHAFFLLFATFLGLWLEKNGIAYWKGVEIVIGQQIITSGRVWATFGIERLSGFARTSFDAAIYIAIFTIYIINYTNGKILKIVIFLFSIYFLILTTTKGVIASFFIIGILFLLRKYLNKKLIIKWLTLLLLFFPLLSFFNEIFFASLLSSYEGQFLLSSLYARMKIAWLEPFNLFSSFGMYLWGRGLGGIGTAQLYFNPLSYLPGDNFLIYYFITFGAIGFIFLIYFLFKVLLRIRYEENIFIFYVVAFILLYGNVINVVESPVLSLMIGIIIAFGYENFKRVKKLV